MLARSTEVAAMLTRSGARASPAAVSTRYRYSFNSISRTYNLRWQAILLKKRLLRRLFGEFQYMRCLQGFGKKAHQRQQKADHTAQKTHAGNLQVGQLGRFT